MADLMFMWEQEIREPGIKGQSPRLMSWTQHQTEGYPMAQIILQIPDECNTPQLQELVASTQRLIERTVAEVERARTTRRLDHEAIETELADAAAKVESAANASVLAALDLDRERVKIGGVLHRRVGRYAGTYYLMAGPVTIERTLYRKVGERNGATVDLVGARIGALHGWSAKTSKAMARLLASVPSREAESTAGALGRAAYSRSSFEDVGHAVGALYADQAHEVEECLAEEFQVPDEATAIIGSLDRTSLPTEEGREPTDAERHLGKPKRPIARVYRMAYVATISFCNAQGESLHTIRYGCTACGDVYALGQSILGDVLAALKQRPDLHVGFVCDGAHENWTLLESLFTNDAVGKEPTFLIDYWHLIEKLSAAARVAYAPSRLTQVMDGWRVLLLVSATAASAIAQVLASTGHEFLRVGTTCPVHDAITYLTNHAARMNYAAARKKGLPIGSGVVEAACKSLIEVRMRRPGARWKANSAGNLLHLRCLTLSDRWDRGMHHAFKRLRPTIALAA
jgi:hypothetical protein